MQILFFFKNLLRWCHKLNTGLWAFYPKYIKGQSFFIIYIDFQLVLVSLLLYVAIHVLLKPAYVLLA